MSEAFSWKGYDLALIHLSGVYGSDADDTETERAIVPVCLVRTPWFLLLKLTNGTKLNKKESVK